MAGGPNTSAPISGKFRGSEKRDRTGQSRMWKELNKSQIGLFVARDCGQSRHVLQQNSTALQVENAVFTPLLQLPINAFARRADEHPELLLRDVHFGAKVFRERTKPARQPDR